MSPLRVPVLVDLSPGSMAVFLILEVVGYLPWECHHLRHLKLLLDRAEPPKDRVAVRLERLDIAGQRTCQRRSVINSEVATGVFRDLDAHPRQIMARLEENDAGEHLDGD